VSDPASPERDVERPLGKELDEATRLLVHLAAAIAGLEEGEVRDALAATRPGRVPDRWVDELVLQSHLFSGFPRALNAAREWRRLVPDAVSEVESDATRDEWRIRGERICAAVYGTMYEKLRRNIATLHPALDDWMLVDGYGKVLGRPGLDLPRRELCIVAACAISGQQRQLHSHLHGALNVGVSPALLASTVDSLEPVLGAERTRSVRLLLGRVLAG
jgi:4-carboxymuconolactone decarboxylase